MTKYSVGHEINESGIHKNQSRMCLEDWRKIRSYCNTRTESLNRVSGKVF